MGKRNPRTAKLMPKQQQLMLRIFILSVIWLALRAEDEVDKMAAYWPCSFLLCVYGPRLPLSL